MRARGSLDLLGPSTKRALSALLAGADIGQAGRSGVTNGAAMRITPVGIAAPSADLGGLVDRVVEASLATHNTGVALAGAAAVAAAVSAGDDGATVREAIGLAVTAARRAARRGHWVAAADVAARITWATGLTAELAGRPGGPDASVVIDAVHALVGTSLAAQESVPAAFAVLAASPDDPWLACRIAASAGGDCDTIAAMAGAIGGACHGRGRLPRRRPGHRGRSQRPAAGRARGRPAASPDRRSPDRRCWPAGHMTPRFSRLLLLGSVVIDIVLDVPALPVRGGDVLATGTDLTPGGGFNVLAAAARQGLRAAYAGSLGSGPFAMLARAALDREHIEVLQRPKPGTDTGFVVAMVDAAGERTFVTSPGAEATMTGDDLSGVQAGPGDAVYLSGYGLVHPSNRAALLDWLVRLSATTAVFADPGPLVHLIPPPVIDTVMARAAWWTCNAAEAERLAGHADPAAAASALASRAARLAVDSHTAGQGAARIRAGQRGRPGGQAGQRGVLVRTGPAGCWLCQAGADPVHVPGFRVGVVDTNGAGDAHAGAFIAALAGGAAEVDAARTANAAAALSVTRRGPATAPTVAELAAFLATS